MVCNINFIELLLTQRGYPQIVGVPFFYGVGSIDIFNSEMWVGICLVYQFNYLANINIAKQNFNIISTIQKILIFFWRLYTIISIFIVENKMIYMPNGAND